MKSITIYKIVSQSLNLDHLETTTSISKNFITPGLSNLSWKKGSLAGSKGASQCEMARKWESLNLLNCHLAIA